MVSSDRSNQGFRGRRDYQSALDLLSQSLRENDAMKDYGGSEWMHMSPTVRATNDRLQAANG